MWNQECRSEGEQLQEGVLAAVVRVAAVSAPGARELVLEFDAARRWVEQSVRVSRRLESIFAAGLSSLVLKRLVCEQQLLPAESLNALRRGVTLLRNSSEDLSEYQRLVLQAADAAARARTWTGLLSSRVSHLEKDAIEEIREVLESEPECVHCAIRSGGPRYGLVSATRTK